MDYVLRKIKELRIAKGMSQDDVAEAIGVNQSNYGKVERGTSQLNLSKLFKIAELLDIPPFILLYNEDGDEWIFNKESQLTIDALKQQLQLTSESVSLYEKQVKQLNQINDLQNQNLARLNNQNNILRTLLKKFYRAPVEMGFEEFKKHSPLIQRDQYDELVKAHQAIIDDLDNMNFDSLADLASA